MQYAAVLVSVSVCSMLWPPFLKLFFNGTRYFWDHEKRFHANNDSSLAIIPIPIFFSTVITKLVGPKEFRIPLSLPLSQYHTAFKKTDSSSSSADISIETLRASIEVGNHYDKTTHYKCDECVPSDILCNGESVLAAGRVSVISVSNMISFNYPR